MKIRILSIVIWSALVSGCSISEMFYGPIETRPLHENNIETSKQGLFGKLTQSDTTFQTISTKGERRLVIFKDNAMGGNPTVCAEPSPDLTESISQIIKASLSGKKSDAELNHETLRSFDTAVGKAFERSNGIQFLRDSNFALCQARMNNWLEELPNQQNKDVSQQDKNASQQDKGIYQQNIEAIRDAAERIILKELELSKTAMDVELEKLQNNPPDLSSLKNDLAKKTDELDKLNKDLIDASVSRAKNTTQSSCAPSC